MMFALGKFANSKLILPALFLLLLVSGAAAQSTNVLQSIKDVFGNQDFGTLYDSYWWVIDLIVYLFFFGYVGRLTLGQQFQQRGGPLGVVVGVALAIAVVFFESTSGFRLGHIGPFGLAVALIIFAIVVYRFFQGLLAQPNQGPNTAALAWTFVAIYGFLLTIAAPLFKWMASQNAWWWNLILALLNLFLLISILAIIWGLGRMVPGMFQGGAQNPLQNIFGGRGGAPPAAQPPAGGRVRQRGQQQGAQQAVQAQRRQQQIAQVVQRINQLQAQLLNAVQQQQGNQQQLINAIAQAIAELINIQNQIRNIP